MDPCEDENEKEHFQKIVWTFENYRSVYLLKVLSPITCIVLHFCEEPFRNEPLNFSSGADTIIFIFRLIRCMYHPKQSGVFRVV